MNVEIVSSSHQLNQAVTSSNTFARADYSKTQEVSHYDRNHTINPNQEFTDSFTLEKVSEPHRSNIRSIKTRARTERKSVGPKMIY